MKERPIHFTGEMVKAILEGRKTQTRRVIRLPRWAMPPNEDGEFEIDDVFVNGERREWPYAIARNTGCFAAIQCPYGAIGDRLYVTETWQAICDGLWWHQMPKVDRGVMNWGVTNPIEPAFDLEPPRWVSGRFMPRWASRIMLEVVNVRVERVQDISDADIVAEGAPKNVCWPIGYSSQLVNWYRTLWDTINAKRGYGWDENPWVWAISFKAVRG